MRELNVGLYHIQGFDYLYHINAKLGLQKLDALEINKLQEQSNKNMKSSK